VDGPDGRSDPDGRGALTFLGAAGTVTGSKLVVDLPAARVMVDCGMFQGARQWRRKNWQGLPLDAAGVDAVVLTHAHLDHCGYLPVLARDGFGGPVLCTPDTARLAAIVLRDAAHVQEADADHARQFGYSKHTPALPLFTAEDAEAAIALLQPLEHGVSSPLPGPGRVCLRRAGHILGSAFAELDVGGSTLMVSGDVGRPGHPFLRPPEQPRPADVVVVESTYGNRRHTGDAGAELASALRRAVERDGVALIPAFAVDRTAVVLHTLATLERAGAIPELPVYVDSPMAMRALEVYRDAAARRDPQLRPEVSSRAALLEPRRLRLMGTQEESRRLNRPGEPCVIVSASGMATGGRVLHHLEAQLPDRRNSVILTGFQVPGTRGAALADGARQVKIHGQYVPVRAEVAVVHGFSAHADADDLVAWLSTMPEPGCAYVVHGEPESAAALAQRLDDELGWAAVVPEHGERVRLARPPGGTSAGDQGMG
jgi:metallo-beta-lactamase family protein